MTDKIKTIIDCDPGHDDAIGLLLAFASKKLKIEGVTITAGNQTLNKTVNNALKVLDFAGIETGVYPGYEKPLIRELKIAPEVHGESGLDGPDFPPLTMEAQKKHAVEFIIQSLRQSQEKITMITTGPMTNLAAAMIGAPDIKEKIKEIIFMGGAAAGGNWTPAAEFNILVDPEAAQFIMKSDLKKTMVGLDVTRKAMFYPEDINEVKSIANPVAQMVGQLLDFFLKFHQEEKGMRGCPLHDPLAVAAAINPAVIKTKLLPVAVECHGEYTTGRTVVDFDQDSYQIAPTNVALEVDRVMFKEMILESLRKY